MFQSTCSERGYKLTNIMHHFKSYAQNTHECTSNTITINHPIQTAKIDNTIYGHLYTKCHRKYHITSFPPSFFFLLLPLLPPLSQPLILSFLLSSGSVYRVSWAMSNPSPHLEAPSSNGQKIQYPLSPAVREKLLSLRSVNLKMLQQSGGSEDLMTERIMYSLRIFSFK